MRCLSSKLLKPAPEPARADSVLAIKAMISVLEEVDQYPALYLNQRVLREAIRRYECLWIPLLAHTRRSERIALVPPLDVEWVWFCHMLCPVKYAVDTAAVWKASRPKETDFLLDHKLLGGNMRHKGKEKARLEWEKRFPNEPFDIITSIRDAPMQDNEPVDQDGKSGSTFKSLISYDIALAASRQMAFHYQVAVMPQYSNKKFLCVAEKRYRKFLKLEQIYPNEIWVPTYDIDVAWHAHMMHPRWYKEETVAMRGSVLAHDDTLNDRSPGSTLANRWEATKTRWTEVFGERLTRDGGMWRGNVGGAERALRPTILSVIKNVESRLNCCGEKRFSVWDEERNRNENFGGTDWIHMTDRRRANYVKTESSDGESVVERYTFLAPSGQCAPLLMCRTSHFLICEPDGNPYSFCTTVEIYASVPRGDNKQPRYPIATAHHALPETVCIGKRPEKNVCALVPGETALVLRIGGEDFALLCGSWSTFRAPKKGVPAVESDVSTGPKGKFEMPEDQGDPGELAVRIWLLGRNSCGEWISLLRCGSRLEPGSFSFKLPCRVEEGITRKDMVSFNLSDATVTAGETRNVIPGYLICMATAALHVALQPRFEPRGGASANSARTMYPAWGVSQKNYALLRGAGGELLSNGRNVGLSVMRLSVKRNNKLPAGFFAASEEELGCRWD